MPVTRLNHAVLYVQDVERTRQFYEGALGFRTVIWMPGQAAFFQAGGLDQRPRPRHVPDRLGSRSQHRRARAGGPLPPGLGGRHPGRARAPRRRAHRVGVAGRRLRPLDHQVALRQGPRRHRVRGVLDRAGGAAHRRDPRDREDRPADAPRPRPRRSPATAPRRAVAWASPSPRRRRRASARPAGVEGLGEDAAVGVEDGAVLQGDAALAHVGPEAAAEPLAVAERRRACGAGGPCSRCSPLRSADRPG